MQLLCGCAVATTQVTYYELVARHGGEVLDVANAGLYILFILNGVGVPSTSRIIQIQ